MTTDKAFEKINAALLSSKNSDEFLESIADTEFSDAVYFLLTDLFNRVRRTGLSDLHMGDRSNTVFHPFSDE